MRLSTAIASVLGIGYFPYAPGTVMSVVAAPLGLLIAAHHGWAALLSASLLAFAGGIWACDAHVRATGRKDPSECVIDELAGQWLACTGAAVMGGGLVLFALAFVLFRLFDILKPWPVAWGETLPGGLGVMTDDMIAGAIAGVLVAGIAPWL